MKIISFMNHKGGVGKTTLCTNISAAIMKLDDPSSIALIDADPQGSLRDWHDATDEDFIRPWLDVVGADRRNTLIQIPNVVQSDYMLIDTPGDIKELHGAALNMSDLVIVPIRPSPYDIWATEDTIELVRTAKQINTKLKAALVINQAIPNSKIHHEVRELLFSYRDFFIPTTHISQRICFAKSASEGKTVFETNDQLAMKEIENVTLGLLNYLFGVSEDGHTS